MPLRVGIALVYDRGPNILAGDLEASGEFGVLRMSACIDRSQLGSVTVINGSGVWVLGPGTGVNDVAGAWVPGPGADVWGPLNCPIN